MHDQPQPNHIAVLADFEMVHNDCMTRSPLCPSICVLVGLIALGLIAVVNPVSSQTTSPAQPAVRPAPVTRDPNTPGYVAAKELPDGANPPANADGNFIIGPTHEVPSDAPANNVVPKGAVIEFTMNSSDSKIYPGIARDAGTFGTPDPADPAKLVVTTSHRAPYRRKVAVYVPQQYVAGNVATRRFFFTKLCMSTTITSTIRYKAILDWFLELAPQILVTISHVRYLTDVGLTTVVTN
jgi:hypothetical protein